MVAAQTIQSLAQELYEAFEGFKRDGSDATVYKLRDGSPEWMKNLVAAAHGEMFPDDWKYETIRDAASFIAERGEDADEYGSDFADECVDVYTTNRLAWLASNLSRVDYVNSAASDYGHGQAEIVDMIGWGQYAEAEEVFASVVVSLRSRLDETDES